MSGISNTDICFSRYNSPIIPIRVGTEPQQEIFHVSSADLSARLTSNTLTLRQVHRSVLLKSNWFRKALCGGFMESSTQSLDLPEEDPAIFHFAVAYLYEDRYVPTKALATALVPDEDKGKGREGDHSSNSHESDSDSSTASLLSNSTARSRQRRERHRRRTDREAERLRQKHPGMHRPNCSCPQCIVSLAPCFGCGFTSRVAHPTAVPPPPLPAPMPGPRSHRHRRRGPDGHPLPRGVSPPPLTPASYDSVRIKGEDMRTWLMALELNIDVYICANKYLLDDFKPKIARVIIDQLETAGSDAAEIEVLHLCTRLYDGVGENDTLLRMMFARAGFLQSALWRKAPTETNEFLLENPEIGALILKEMAIRGETEIRSGIPSMERSSLQSPPFLGTMHQYRPQQAHRHRAFY